jgi:hypothetical protein
MLEIWVFEIQAGNSTIPIQQEPILSDRNQEKSRLNPKNQLSDQTLRAKPKN